MKQSSVAGLMGLIVACAIGLAALRGANELWAGLLSLLTTALLGVAILNVIHREGLARARWIGFLVFAGGYLMLTCGPWSSDGFGSGLATTQIFVSIHERVRPNPVIGTDPYERLNLQRDQLLQKLNRTRAVVRNVNTDPSVKNIQNQLATVDRKIAAMLGPNSGSPNRWRTLLPGAADRYQFLQVGHCLFALIAGWCGAALSWRIHRGRSLQVT